MALTTRHLFLHDEHFYIKSKGHKVPRNSKQCRGQPAEIPGASWQTALCKGEARSVSPSLCLIPWGNCPLLVRPVCFLRDSTNPRAVERSIRLIFDWNWIQTFTMDLFYFEAALAFSHLEACLLLGPEHNHYDVMGTRWREMPVQLPCQSNRLLVRRSGITEGL